MIKTPRPYQEEARVWAKGKKAIYLAMQMRLGKTFVTLLILNDRKIKNALILAPKTTLISWEEELEGECLPYTNLAHGSVKKRIEALKTIKGFVLLNYETLRNKAVRKLLDTMEPFPFDAIVMDEATQLKSPKAQATKTLMRISDRCGTKIALSGLPTPQSWFDVWSQMAILHDGHWMGCGNFYKWQSKISEPNELGYGREITSEGERQIKEAYHRDAFVLSRKDAGLGEEKIYQKIQGELTKEQRDVYLTIVRDWEIPGIAVQPTSQTKYAMVLVSWLRRLCGGHLPDRETESWKYDELGRLLSTDFKRERVVVWFAFNSEIKRAIRVLDDRSRRRIIPLMGTSGRQERRTAISRFRETPDSVLFIQLKLGQFGLNLSASDVAIYFSNSYSLEQRGQSEDRIVMPEKPRPLLYIDFVTRNSVEEEVIDALRSKKLDANRLLRKTLGFGGSGPGGNGVGILERKEPPRKRIRFVLKPSRNVGSASDEDLF